MEPGNSKEKVEATRFPPGGFDISMMVMSKFCYHYVHNVGWNRLVSYCVLYREFSNKLQSGILK